MKYIQGICRDLKAVMTVDILPAVAVMRCCTRTFYRTSSSNCALGQYPDVVDLVQAGTIHISQYSQAHIIIMVLGG